MRSRGTDRTECLAIGHRQFGFDRSESSLVVFDDLSLLSLFDTNASNPTIGPRDWGRSARLLT